MQDGAIISAFGFLQISKAQVIPMKRLSAFILALVIALLPIVALGASAMEEADYSHIVDEYSWFSMKGLLNTEGLEGDAAVELYNVRLLTTQRLGTIPLSGAASINLETAVEPMVNGLAVIDEKKSLPVFPFAGEMELRISYQAGDENKTIAYPIYFCGKNPTCFNVNSEVTFNIKKMADGRLDDGNYNTVWDPNGKRLLEFTIPEDVHHAMVQLEWMYAQNEYKLTCYDKNGETLEVFNAEDDERLFVRNFYLPEDTAKCGLKITSKQRVLKLGELHVFDMDRLSPQVQQWEPTPEKADIMVISAHQDDELLFFGATIPDSASRGKSIVMLYMANCGRGRYSEALAGLWSVGLRTRPVFLGLEDAAFRSKSAAMKSWPKYDTVDELVYNIRKYQPEVIVTHDTKGEYGHMQHKLTSEYVQRAVTLAASSSYVCITDKKLPAWTVKKFYIHLYPKNVMHIQSDVPCEFFGGFTTQEAAIIAYDKHYTQHGHYTMANQGVQYDNTAFGLVSSTVGEDVEKNDLFENLE